MLLNDILFKHSTISSIMIIFGIMIKNSGNKLGFKDYDIITNISAFLFIGGWLYLTYALSLYRSNKIPIIISSLTIVATVTFMKTYIKNDNKALKGIFALAWIILGYAISEHLPNESKYYGFIAIAMVLYAMKVALPYERKQCLIDGPGMPMYIIAMFIIVILNSIR